MAKTYSHIIYNPPRKSLERSYELARQMIPVLISWAQEHRSPQYYSTLTKTIGHNTPSKAWLKKQVWGAYLDTPLWIYLQNQEWRTKLRDFIIDKMLTNP